jgi:hypothetical protein
LDVKEAAEVLGISSEGVRKRIKRGSLESEKDPEGRVYVWLDEGGTGSDGTPDGDWTADRTGSEEDALVVEVLREQVADVDDQVAYLREMLEAEREANRENRRIIASLVQRVPELEPARDTSPEPRESPVSPGEEAGKG